MAFSENSWPSGFVKISSVWSPLLISSRMSSAGWESGTVWSCSIFMRSPGIFHIGPVGYDRSISVHRAPTTSFVRATVKIRNLSASAARPSAPASLLMNCEASA